MSVMGSQSPAFRSCLQHIFQANSKGDIKDPYLLVLCEENRCVNVGSPVKIVSNAQCVVTYWHHHVLECNLITCVKSNILTPKHALIHYSVNIALFSFTTWQAFTDNWPQPIHSMNLPSSQVTEIVSYAPHHIHVCEPGSHEFKMSSVPFLFNNINLPRISWHIFKKCIE